jgi:hypothetical protein
MATLAVSEHDSREFTLDLILICYSILTTPRQSLSLWYFYYNFDVNSGIPKELDMPASNLQTVENWSAELLPKFQHSDNDGEGQDKENSFQYDKESFSISSVASRIV